MKKIQKVMAVMLCCIMLFAGLPVSYAKSDLPEVNVVNIVRLDDFNYITVDENGKVIEETASKDALDGSSGTSLPSKYDTREEIKLNVGDQGSTQSCWAFSTMSAFEADAIKRGYAQNGNINLSEAHLVWFTKNSATTDTTDATYGDGETDASPYTSGGTWNDSVFTLARGSGPVYDSDFPFNDDDTASMSNFAESVRYQREFSLAEAEYLDDAEMDKVKAEIMEHGAVKASYYSKSLYYNGDKSAYYQNEVSDTTSHAITVVGWDDDYAVSNFNSNYQPASPGAWLCMNSWGEDSGDNGFFWISYFDTSFTHVTSFTVSKEVYEDVYQYDGAGYHSWLYFNGYTTSSSANVFTAEKDELLKAVGFYTVQNDVDYTVKIYKGVTSTPTDSGAPVYTSGGYEAYKGFHTVVLDEALEVEKGTKFSVCVTITAKDGSNALIPIEGKNDISSANEGESWLSAGSSAYMDLNSGNYNYNNVAIKAYTTHAECDFVYTSSVVDDCACEYDLYTCSKCRETQKRITSAASNHDWDNGVVTLDPTCTEKGTRLFTCKRADCGETKTEDIQPTGHDHKVVTTPPTCTAGGYDTYTCACGDTYTANETALLGHQWGNCVVTVKPTCTAEGECVYTCERVGCDATKTEKVAKISHADSDGNGKCDGCGQNVVNVCDCNCHATGFRLLIHKIICFFWKLFKINPVCACGTAHY